jgi:hypothetical protein
MDLLNSCTQPFEVSYCQESYTFYFSKSHGFGQRSSLHSSLNKYFPYFVCFYLHLLAYMSVIYYMSMYVLSLI